MARNDELRIPVAAPGDGLYYQMVNERTPFAVARNKEREALPERMFHRSQVRSETGEKGKFTLRSFTYRRPLAKRWKGNKTRRWAKRGKVKLMREMGHPRGDNRPFVLTFAY